MHSNSSLATSKPTTTSSPTLVKGNTMHPGFDFYFNRLFPILLASIGGMTQVHLTCFYWHITCSFIDGEIIISEKVSIISEKLGQNDKLHYPLIQLLKMNAFVGIVDF